MDSKREGRVTGDVEDGEGSGKPHIDSKRRVRKSGNVEDGEGSGKSYTGYDKVPSNSKTQWESYIATLTVNSFEARSDREKPEDEDDDPASQVDVPASQVDQASQLEYLMVVHKALVEQLNTFGIILTLLVAVTSVAILQPPSSFTDQGHMSPSKLVACYLMFSSVSFLLACTGLMAVIVGSASLLRPWFFNKLSFQSDTIHMITSVGQGTNHNTVVYDDIPTLGKIILDNLFRVRRLRIYLAFSLGLCMVAFVCGASAILGPQSRNMWIAIGTIIASGFVLIFETIITLLGPTQSPKWLRKCIRLVQSVAFKHPATLPQNKDGGFGFSFINDVRTSSNVLAMSRHH